MTREEFIWDYRAARRDKNGFVSPNEYTVADLLADAIFGEEKGEESALEKFNSKYDFNAMTPSMKKNAVLKFMKDIDASLFEHFSIEGQKSPAIVSEHDTGYIIKIDKFGL